MTQSSKQVLNEAGSDISDSWITATVELPLLYTSNVAGSAIYVTTNKGAEQARGIELAKNGRAFKSVHSKELIF